jgi:hypothetical protein
VAVDPLVDRLAVGEADDPHRDEPVDLRQDVLVEHGRPLRDERDPMPLLRPRRTMFSVTPSSGWSPACGFCGAKRSASSMKRCTSSLLRR